MQPVRLSSPADDARGAVRRGAARPGAAFVAGGTELLPLCEGRRCRARPRHRHQPPAASTAIEVARRRGRVSARSPAWPTSPSHPVDPARPSGARQALAGERVAAAAQRRDRRRQPAAAHAAAPTSATPTSPATSARPAPAARPARREPPARDLRRERRTAPRPMPSDLAVALVALGATRARARPRAGRRARSPSRTVPSLPGDTPERESALERGRAGRRRSRCRAAPRGARATSRSATARRFEFARRSRRRSRSTSRTARSRAARLAAGGVGTVPWRLCASEQALAGARCRAGGDRRGRRARRRRRAAARPQRLQGRAAARRAPLLRRAAPRQHAARDGSSLDAEAGTSAADPASHAGAGRRPRCKVTRRGARYRGARSRASRTCCTPRWSTAPMPSGRVLARSTRARPRARAPACVDVADARQRARIAPRGGRRCCCQEHGRALRRPAGRRRRRRRRRAEPRAPRPPRST